MSPELLFPSWLMPAVHLYGRAEAAMRREGPKVRAVLSTPTQHGKSTLSQHAIAYIVGRNPRFRHIYASYGVDLAEENSGGALSLVQRCGLPLARTSAKRWRTREKGGVLAVGVDGRITGQPATGVVLIDDPHKNRKEAESLRLREAAKAWYRSDVLGRVHPTSSIICIASRMHEDDLPSYLINEYGFEYVCLPAVLGEGDIWAEEPELLAPELYDVETLREKAKDEYEWWSLFMGQPRPRGEALFGQAHTIPLAAIPLAGRTVIGVDLAYTKRSRADRTAAVVLRELDGRRYVVEVLQFQLAADEGVAELQKLSARYPNAPLVWHGSSTEVGGAEAIRALGLPQLRPRLAKADKYVRAQETSVAWRNGKILVAGDATWTASFLDVVQSFTGVNDSNDDAVDALTSAFDELGPIRDHQASQRGVATSGHRRTTVGLKRSF